MTKSGKLVKKLLRKLQTSEKSNKKWWNREKKKTKIHKLVKESDKKSQTSVKMTELQKKMTKSHRLVWKRQNCGGKKVTKSDKIVGKVTN